MDRVEAFVEQAEGRLAGCLRRSVCLSEHTSYRIGGPASVVIEVAAEQDVATVLQLCRALQLGLAVLGNGSNVIAPDAGLDGVVLRFGPAWAAIERRGERHLFARSGAILAELSQSACQAGRRGCEWMFDIPGSIGGALRMNAGNDQGEMKAIVRSVRCMDLRGRVRELSVDELEMDYRHSRFQHSGEIVLGATFALGEVDDSAAIFDRMQQSKQTRWSKFPMEWPNGGSVFRRPSGHYAGKLIQDCGLKGLRVGDAQVAEKHAGFIVNRGQATAADLLELIRQVQDRVFERFGVRLEMEQIPLRLESLPPA